MLIAMHVQVLLEDRIIVNDDSIDWLRGPLDRLHVAEDLNLIHFHAKLLL